jgi:methionyl-tRNA formyltransferase
VRVAFFGTPAFAVPTLAALVEAGHTVVAVVAQPDRPQGRGQQLQSPPTVERARALGIPVHQPTKLRSGPFPETFEAMGLDCAVVVAYGRILPPRLLAAPRHGCVNVHASLLPRWRGAAPIQWAILAGDRTTGVCTMQMAEGLDTGDVLLRVETPIGVSETSGALHDRLAILGAELAVRTLAALGTLTPAPQPEDGVTHARMLTKDDGRLDWSRTSDALDAQVRGVTPWPGAYTAFRGDTLKVLKARGHGAEGAGPLRNASPGTVAIGPAGAPLVACGEGALELLEVQLPGRRAVRGADFVNGARVAPGERFG